jgi:hypothetical protein
LLLLDDKTAEADSSQPIAASPTLHAPVDSTLASSSTPAVASSASTVPVVVDLIEGSSSAPLPIPPPEFAKPFVTNHGFKIAV